MSHFLNLLFYVDEFAVLMMILVGFIGLCVYRFSSRYMVGDSQYRSFSLYLIFLILSVSVMMCADNLILLFIVWSLSNLLLVRLMIHKSRWKAANASGILAIKHYSLGVFCIGSAFTILHWVTGEMSIKAITQQNASSTFILLALILILIGAMTQSAIWPFHRWLISSLNSPTPVSAIMHAGLVNGGGFLLVRFAPLYLKHTELLTAIFVLGFITALLGTLWKLIQSDVKRMLACSTMGQMGFMLVQCGLGLFPAAVAHLVFHGMFKAYLFLVSGSAAQEKRFDPGYPPNVFPFICALLCGVVGSLGFGYVTGNSWSAGDTTLVLMVMTFLIASQFALMLLRVKTLRHFPLALIATTVGGGFYGTSVELIARMLEPMQLMQPQSLNVFHILGVIILTLAWLSILFIRSQAKRCDSPSWILRGYVAALNASQPYPATVTAHRNDYQY